MGRILAVVAGSAVATAAMLAWVIVAAVGVASSTTQCDLPVAEAGGMLDLTILGPPSTTPAQLADWYRKAGYTDPASTIGVPLEELAGDYVLFGTAEGVRPEVAWVQAAVETGGFTNDDSRRLNNFAGIGHCDMCESGMAFPSAAVGVDAQIQLLHRVVSGNSVALAGPTVAPTWGGRQASTLGGLAANWASSPTYGEVLATDVSMLLTGAGVAPSAAPSNVATCPDAGAGGFPLPRSSIRSESWLTKPHHDFPAADIPVPAGTPVFAPVDGTVVAAPVGGDCGRGVSILDGGGNTWTLCHGSDGGQIEHAGDRVRVGELVMHSASTGATTGPHLHIQIMLANGALVCPQAWLDATWRGASVPSAPTLPVAGCTH